MSDRRERPTLQVTPLRSLLAGKEDLLVSMGPMEWSQLEREARVTEAEASELREMTRLAVEAMHKGPPPPPLRIAEQGAVPEECVDGDDTVPWCIACESFGTPACIEHGSGHIPARLGRVGRR